MKSMNLEKISTLMDNFEQQFEDLDVQVKHTCYSFLHLYVNVQLVNTMGGLEYIMCTNIKNIEMMNGLGLEWSTNKMAFIL